VSWFSYGSEWLQLLLRWAHLITGIAWIGSSFYFMWLDQQLNVPPRDPEHADVAGDLWAVHGGGFYHAQKYRIAPGKLPEPLHWFMWEAYFTWITGFLLLIAVYYLNARTLLIDPRVAALEPAIAVATSLGLLLAGWLVYDGLCRLALPPRVFASLGAGALLLLCWATCQIFSARAAFLQTGAVLGTVMAANVFRVIIPGQRQLVAAKLAGRAPDPAPGLEAKRRSTHNNYLTLPVVFVMISPHFPMVYAHRWNWAILFALCLIGALVRHYFNLRNQGRHLIVLPLTALAALLILAVLVAPPALQSTAVSSAAADFGAVRRIIDVRCVPCHSATPTHPTAPVPAAGVVFDTPEDIANWAPRIHERAVITRTMPLGNLTGMTDEERAVLAAWQVGGATTKSGTVPR
jgi:uncharacterized membrane protein